MEVLANQVMTHRILATEEAAWAPTQRLAKKRLAPAREQFVHMLQQSIIRASPLRIASKRIPGIGVVLVITSSLTLGQFATATHCRI